MKVISVNEELGRLGVITLTGEADGTTVGRMLCDLTEEGAALLSRFLGGTVKVDRGSNWNHSQGQVASAMLTWATLRELVEFALVEENPSSTLLVWPDREMYLCDNNDEIAEVKQAVGNDNFRRVFCWGTAGTRNVHEISGRVV